MSTVKKQDQSAMERLIDPVFNVDCCVLANKRATGPDKKHTYDHACAKINNRCAPVAFVPENPEIVGK